MFTYQRKTPKFVAVQFDGTSESIKKMQSCFDIDRYMLTSVGFKIALELEVHARDAAPYKATLGENDWLVLDVEARTLSPMSHDDFNKQFEVAK